MLWQKHIHVHKNQTTSAPTGRLQNENISRGRPCHQTLDYQKVSFTKTPWANLYPNGLRQASFYLSDHHPLAVSLSFLRAVPPFCPSLPWSRNSPAFLCWPPFSSVIFIREWRLLLLGLIYSHELCLNYYFCISSFFIETNISTQSNNLVFVKFYEDQKCLCGF